MQISISSNLDEVRRQLANFSDRRFNAALATALTRTAVAVRSQVAADLPRLLDRPTPYTMRQLRYVGATADRLAAAVGFNVVRVSDERGGLIEYRNLGPNETPAGKYLTPQIEGGSRRDKRFEKALRSAGALQNGWYVVPGAGAKLDAYGGVSRGQIVQVLSQLRIQLVAGSSRNMSTDARKQITAQRKAGGRFFVIQPGAKVQPGIYQREFFGRNITPVFVFVQGVSYRKRFDFYGIADRAAQSRLPQEISKAIAESAARMRSAR